MKTKFLIIIAIVTVSVIITSIIGTLDYQIKYNQNCYDRDGKVTGFLRYTVIHEDFDISNPFTVGIEFDHTF
ncbi:MAG: hypothetical protein ACRBB5_07755 [Nitrosopumilus sp.]